MYRTKQNESGMEIRVRQLAILLLMVSMTTEWKQTALVFPYQAQTQRWADLDSPIQSGRAEPYVKLVSQSESVQHGQRIPKENATPVIAKQRSTNKQFRRLTQKDLTGSDARLTVDLTLLGMVMF